jgi:hypothetical protein
MVTWKITPVLYQSTINYIHIATRYPCAVCNSHLNGPITEVLPITCSNGGSEWTKLKQDILLPVYVCSDLCANMFIISVI